MLLMTNICTSCGKFTVGHERKCLYVIPCPHSLRTRSGLVDSSPPINGTDQLSYRLLRLRCNVRCETLIGIEYRVAS